MAEELGDEFAKEPTPPPKKRSLFSKTTWSQAPAHKEGIDFFSRADELYPIRIAEEERKRQKKFVKLERVRSTASAEGEASCSPNSKKRRVSQVEQRNEHSSDSSPNLGHQDGASWARRESTQSTPASRKSPSSSSQHKLQTSSTSVIKSEGATKGYISLSDSDNDHSGNVPLGRKVAPEPINLDDEDDLLQVPAQVRYQLEEDDQVSDEEFPELVWQARERERQKELDRLEAGKSFKEHNHTSNGTNKSDHVVDDIFQGKSSTSDIDPVIEIFVSSWIEGTKPLMVRRKLSQRLREVRLSWCDKQLISGQVMTQAVKASIFLTWRGKRLFDVSTCRSLGLKTDINGKLFSDSDGFLDGKVHFEAWTEDLFVLHQTKLAAKQENSEAEDEPEVIQDTLVRIKLIMKARDMEPFKLVVKPTTIIEKMVTAFRQARNIPEEKNIVLHFDGDKLDAESKIEDTELSEMDTLDVHIR